MGPVATKAARTLPRGQAAFEARGGPVEESSGEYLMLSWKWCREAPGSRLAYFLLLWRTEPTGRQGVSSCLVGSQASVSPSPQQD